MKYRIVTSEYNCINKDACQVERRGWQTLWRWEEFGLSSSNLEEARRKIRNKLNPIIFKKQLIEHFPKG